MPTLSLAILVMTVGLLTLMTLLLCLSSGPSLSRLAAELVMVALLLSAVSWSVVAVAQRHPQ